MKAEKWQKICLPSQEEPTQVKGEDSVGDKKDNYEHVGQWRKIAIQLSLENNARLLISLTLRLLSHAAKYIFKLPFSETR